jgi:hypothetical protein
MTLLYQNPRQVNANKPRSTHDQNPHSASLPYLRIRIIEAIAYQ